MRPRQPNSATDALPCGCADPRGMDTLLEGRADARLPCASEGSAAQSQNVCHDSLWCASADDALAQLRDRFDAVFNSVEAGIFFIDTETHRIVDANPVALALVGAPAEKVCGAICHKFVCPADAGRCPVTDLGQTVDNSERVLLTATGQKRAIIKTVRPVTMHGRPYLLESFLDISDRKRAEQNLAEQSAYLNGLFEVSPLGIMVLDQNERIRMANKAFERLFLYTREQLQGASASELLAPGDLAAESRFFAQECLHGRSVHFVTRRHRCDNALIDVEVYGVPLAVPGQPPGILVLYHDITARTRIEAEMAENHRLATLAAEAGDALTGAEDFSAGLEACAAALVRNMQLSFARVWILNADTGALELRAAAGGGVPSSEDDQRLREVFGIDRLAASGEPQFGVLSLEGSTSSDLSATLGAGFAACPLKAGNQVLGVTAVFARQPLSGAALQAFGSVNHSLTQFVERQRAEAGLRESEDRFRTAFEEAPWGMCMTAPSGRFLHANAALCRTLGYSQAELLTGAWQSITHPADLELSRRASVQFAEGAQSLEIEKRYLQKHGDVVWARVRIVAVRDVQSRVSHYITQIEDITERKLSEERLRASEERYRDLFENASDLVGTLDLDLRFTSLNRLAELTLGYTREEAKQLGLRQLVEPDQWQRIEPVLQRVIAGEPGKKFAVDIRALDRRRVTLEINPRLIRRNGEATGIQCIARDITGRDQAEMELRQAQKLESVGRLASGIAHEINTPMQFVGDNVRFLHDAFADLRAFFASLSEHSDGSVPGSPSPAFVAEFRRLTRQIDLEYLLREIPEALSQTQEGVERVVTIVRAMKEFAHPDAKGMSRADLNKALVNTLTVARNELKYVAEVETDFGDLPPVVCSVSDMNQVFLNLFVNAAHAIGDVVRGTEQKGRIRIHTEKQGSTVLITISDTGCGIPESIRERIFDPFFTTKEVGRGTGQGLAIARSVVDRHKGTLTFESELGKGTTFFIRLPVQSSEPSIAP
jgi:two-component system, NtrC family, sensor kinase